LIQIMPTKTITIFGTSRAKAGDSIYTLALETGRLLAHAGFAIANGGYGGTMLAAAEGAARAGGEIVGVTCSAFKARANRYVTREIATKSLDERLDTLIELGRAYIVLPGGTGTLLELAKVWELRNKGFLKPDRPIILMGEFWRPVVELLATDDPDCRRYVKLADDPAQAVELLNGS